MPPSQLNSVAVIGAGTMGAGVAERFAEAGHDVVLWTRSAATLNRARERIAKNQVALVEAGLLTEEQASAARERIRCTNSLGDAAGAQFVSENVAENAATKQDLFVQLEELAAADAVLSTNTSGIPITVVQAKCAHPERVVGMHWWNPPHLVPLVEVIKGERTSDEAAQFTSELCLHLGKRPILVKKDVPGFVGNRLQAAIVREALSLYASGVASAEDIDIAVQCGFGFRFPVLGPLRTIDFAGLDVWHAVSSSLFNEIDDSHAPSPLLKELTDEGHHGAKSGKGIYDYPDNLAERIMAERDRQFLALLRLQLGAFEAAKKKGV